MKNVTALLSALGVGALVLFMTRDKKASAATGPMSPPFVPAPDPVNPVITLEEVVIYGDPTQPASPNNPPVVYRVGDRVRVLHLGRIGVIVDFPSAIDPRYPPVGVQIPNFPYQVFASQNIQHV